MKLYDIMVAGHICLDIIPDMSRLETDNIEKILSPGLLTHVGKVSMSIGGPVSNVGSNMHDLGNVVCYSARVGNDAIGKTILETIESRGNTRGISISNTETKTSYTISLSPKNIDRIYLHYSGTNDEYSSKDVDISLLEKCRHFHFGYPPLMRNIYLNDGQELTKIFKLAKEKNTITSLDMSLPDVEDDSGKVNWKLILENVLPYVDIFVPSVEEMFFMLYPGEYFNLKNNKNCDNFIDQIYPIELSRLSDIIFDMGCGDVLLKMGHRGIYYRSNKDKEYWAPAVKSNHIVDATGAGDSAIAGFLSAYTKGLDITKCLKYASICGYQNVIYPGASGALHSWEHTTELLENKDLEYHTPIYNNNGWVKISESLWKGPNDENKN